MNVIKIYKSIIWGGTLMYISSTTAQTTELLETQLSGNVQQSITDLNGQLTSNDHQIINYSLSDGTVFNTNLLDELDAADLDALHLADDCGPNMYSMDIFTSINNQVINPADVFSDDGTLVLDANSLGLPAGSNVDAVTRNPANCDLIVSFDGFIELGGTVYSGGHLISWNATDGFSEFNDSLAGLPVDALYILENNHLLVSFANTVTVLGTIAQPNDVIEINPSNVSAISFNPLLIDSSWERSNLDALNVTSVLKDDLIFINGFE